MAVSVTIAARRSDHLPGFAGLRSLALVRGDGWVLMGSSRHERQVTKALKASVGEVRVLPPLAGASAEMV
jgi:hypothetical protein